MSRIGALPNRCDVRRGWLRAKSFVTNRPHCTHSRAPCPLHYWDVETLIGYRRAVHTFFKLHQQKVHVRTKLHVRTILLDTATKRQCYTATEDVRRRVSADIEHLATTARVFTVPFRGLELLLIHTRTRINLRNHSHKSYSPRWLPEHQVVVHRLASCKKRLVPICAWLEVIALGGA